MSYATIAEADAVLGADWLALTATQKQFNLDIGALWIDENYTCDYTAPYPANLVTANIMLAEQNRLESSGGTTQATSIIKTKVVAGDVSSEKQYGGGGATVTNVFDEVGLLLRSVCSSGGTYSSIFGTIRV